MTRGAKRSRNSVVTVPVGRPSQFKRPRRTPAMKTFEAASRSIPVGNGGVAQVIPTSNKFASLATMGENEIVMQQEKAPKLRVPPITVFNTTSENIINILEKSAITDFKMKPLKHGHQIYCGTVEIHQAVLTNMTTAKIHHYSHDLPSDHLYKVALYNLTEKDHAKLETELTELGVKPEKIRAITPKKARYSQQRVFILYYKKGTTSLQSLQKIDTLCKTVVEWRPFQKFNQGPTQCTKCQRPGHGNRYCQMPPRCEFCAENHDSKACPEVAKHANKDSMEDDAPTETKFEIPAKCCNCNEVGHFATDPKCPRKISYAERRRRAAARPNGRYRDTAPRYNDFTEFPELTSSSNRSPPKTTQPNGLSYAKVSSSSNLPHSFSNLTSPNSQSKKIEEPFSFEEVLALTSEVLSQFRDIKSASREQVVMKVMNIAFKFIYHGGAP